MYYDLFILGSIMEEPHYGYEIKKKLSEGFRACSPISNNTLYPILKKFQDLGATRKTVETVEGKPSRIIYHITDEGRRLFVDQLRHFSDSLLHSRDDFFMRLVYFHYLDRETRVRVLDVRQAFLEQCLDHIFSRSAGAPLPDTTQFHIDLLRSECALIGKFRARLDEPCRITADGILQKERADGRPGRQEEGPL